MITKQEAMLEREQIANRRKHWVRAVTACNSRCVFCLDMDTPRNVFLPYEEVCAELQRGIDELGADKVIISGGEASLHPQFTDLITYAKDIGYDRVQTVTNGWQYADRTFYRKCINAGLGEITFSLHGHTPELHDRLTKHHGSFKRLLKAMVRAVRDPKGPIVNVDVVINKQNVSVLDKIVELCASLGVREFDLLHVIPQSEAFRNREMLFYDVRDHMEVLHKVFRLNRHPGFVIWTNRFPVSYLGGLEDLIQDPHKMLDEVNGRRYQVRRYLDAGEPLDCREPERCVHCFIEPFCNSMDNFVEAQNEETFEVWDLGTSWQKEALPHPLPYGCSRIGVHLASPEQVQIVPFSQPLEVRCHDGDTHSLPVMARDIRWIAERASQLERWLQDFPTQYTLEIWLNKDTAAWMLDNQEILRQHKRQIRVHQPSYEKMAQSIEQDLEQPVQFFQQMSVVLPTSGLPACIARNVELVKPTARIQPKLFDWSSGRVQIRALARRHIEEGYFAKSVRCRDCRLNDHCEGIHINLVRSQGLQLAQPMQSGDWFRQAQRQLQGWPDSSSSRVAMGRDSQPVAPSLPSFALPQVPPRDPLAVIAEEKEKRQRERKRKRRIALGLPIKE